MRVTDDRGIRSLNRTWLGRDRPTNVLSFPQGRPRRGEGGRILLGDVVVSAETARREARGAEIPPEQRLQRLVVHGILHLVGFDHEGGDPLEGRRMMAAERRIMRALGRGAP